MCFRVLVLLISTFAIFSKSHASGVEAQTLPAFAQTTDVHGLAKTYCRDVWQAVNAPEAIGYGNKDSAEFDTLFQGSIEELQGVLSKVAKGEPINEADEYFDKSSSPVLQLALNSMKVKGKHKGQSDKDNETNAHVNEVFVYCWHRVTQDPSRLNAFLFGLQDAASTCIQGYSVRMLCAVHPPKFKVSQ